MNNLETIHQQIMAKGIAEATSDNGTYIVKCPICGQYYNELEYCNEICEECQERLERESTTQNAMSLGRDCRQNVKINSYLLRYFTETQIEVLLETFLIDNKGFQDQIAREFCLEDKESFNEFLEGKK